MESWIPFLDVLSQLNVSVLPSVLFPTLSSTLLLFLCLWVGDTLPLDSAAPSSTMWKFYKSCVIPENSLADHLDGKVKLPCLGS